MAVKERPPAGGVDGLAIAIVGLGLMGGSIAKALKRGSNATVMAVDRDAGLIAQALAGGVIDRGGTIPEPFLREADLTVVCLYPQEAVAFIRHNMHAFKLGSVVTDICGVKGPVIDGVLPFLHDGIDFIPGHPMAGRERAGYSYSDAALFDGCNYIVTPLATNQVYNVELVKRFAGALGAGAIVLAEAREHDTMIAYTSQLPHALAVAYVLAAGGRDPLPFSAGSFRDVSRVAAINASMWAELFLSNSSELLAEIEALRDGIGRISDCIRMGDGQALADLLADAARLKEERL